jgi:GntR family transcriptional regulator
MGQAAEAPGERPRVTRARVRRVTTDQTGRPVEWSDDRYRSDAINFSIHNSIGSSPLARQAGPGLAPDRRPPRQER